MSETAYIVKCRGGFADGHYRLGGRVPEEVTITERDGDRSQLYVYEGGEEQARNVTDGKTRETKRVVEAVFHIFRPASGDEAR